jgi:hypothetical protein
MKYKIAISFLLVIFLQLVACTPLPGPVPPFAKKPFVPFNREDTIAIAMREWRLFGSQIQLQDELIGQTFVLGAADKADRKPGLWQRVGEYWWIGLARAPGMPSQKLASWTGKHNAKGEVFPEADEGKYAWSAAFISYVMRIAGAGDRFPYASTHATYVNAAASGASPILKAESPEEYAPVPGDLICLGRGRFKGLHFNNLPTSYVWKGHCDLVVNISARRLSVIGGNVHEAVTLKYVPITPQGLLVYPNGVEVDPAHPWFVVLHVLYDAEAEPADIC